MVREMKSAELVKLGIQFRSMQLYPAATRPEAVSSHSNGSVRCGGLHKAMQAGRRILDSEA